MRIAVSGTHFMGKTTFINDFIKIHPDYLHEGEPYFQLQELGDLEASEEPTVDLFMDQLDYSLERLHAMSHQPHVIFDRCPIDFVAYMTVLLNQSGSDIYETYVAEKFLEIKEALETLETIVFFPIMKAYEAAFSGEENDMFRKVVDRSFKEIYRDDKFDLFPSYDHPVVIELGGYPKDRIHKMETFLDTSAIQGD